MAASTATAFDYDIPAERPADVPTVPFTISGEKFVMVQPKMSVAIGMVQLVENAEQYTVQDFGRRLAALLWQLLAYVQEEVPQPEWLPNPEYDPDAKGRAKPPEFVKNPMAFEPQGRGRILQRLNNPHDGMDIMNLEPIFRDVVSAMFDRPTGPSPASSAKSRSTGSGSGAASRGRRAATSGNSRRASSSQPARTSRAKTSSAASKAATK